MDLTFNRSRSRNERKPTHMTWVGQTWANGKATPFSGSEQRGNEGEAKTIQDNVTRGYRRKRARGEIVLGDLRIRTENRVVTNGTYSRSDSTLWPGYYCVFTGDLAYPVEIVAQPTFPLQADMERMADLALAKAYAKIGEAALMSGEASMQMTQTLGMLRRPFKSSRQLLEKIWKYRAKRLGKTVQSATRATADAWLEYRYGWRPLVLDAHTTIQEFLSLRERSKRLCVVRSSESRERNSTRNFTRVYPADNPGWKYTGSVACLEHGSAHAGVLYELASSSVSDEMARVFGTRSSDFAPTLWENVPYSFVADWFVNVGTWLQAHSLPPTVRIRGNWVSFKYKASAHWSGGLLEEIISASNVKTGNWGSSQRTWDEFTRECNRPLAALPSRKLSPLSWNQTADGLALSAGKIISALKGLRH